VEAYARKRKKKREKKKERDPTHLFKDTSLPHLVSFFLALPFLVLLVGRGVTTQAPSSNNNNNNNTNTNINKRKSRTQSQKKFVAFNIRQQRVVFLELNCKERKNT
jgi:hypothetical protein